MEPLSESAPEELSAVFWVLLEVVGEAGDEAVGALLKQNMSLSLRESAMTLAGQGNDQIQRARWDLVVELDETRQLFNQQASVTD
jgi:hypothetical protein